MPDVTADLHTHTSFSDGRLSPRALAERLFAAGLSTFAVTDHDTVDGLPAASAAARELGLGWVSGIEISAQVGDQEVHLLGYHFDPEHESIVAYTEEFRRRRVRRVEAIVSKLMGLGVELQMERVLEIAGPGSVGRPHVAHALVEAGHSPSFEHAFRDYLSSRAPAFVPTEKVLSQDAIRLVHDAGGLVVLAHPGQWTDDRAVMQLIREGIDGLEVSHPAHNATLESYYADLARQFVLITTGGSDYHGIRDNDDEMLGQYGVSEKTLERIADKARQVKSRGGKS